MMFKKTFIKTICITLLVTLLTFSVGRVTRVSAVASTAAIAGAALLATGAVFVGYVALTHGSISVPASSDISSWLTDIGKKVVQYSSCNTFYSDFYTRLLDPTVSVNDLLATLTADDLRSLYNDFSDTRIIQSILSYSVDLDIHTQVTNHFVYPFDLMQPSSVRDGYSSSYIPIGIFSSSHVITYGIPCIVSVYGDQIYHTIVYYYGSYPVRNILHSDNTYGIQIFSNGYWSDYTSSFRVGLMIDDLIYGIDYNSTGGLHYTSVSATNESFSNLSSPAFTQSDIYDQDTGTVITADDPVSTELVTTPSWLDPDNENRPIVPYVPIPFDPTVNTPGGGNGWWGLPIGSLLDLLEQLSEGLLTIGALGHLINEFADSLTGDTYYISYNDESTGDIYYQYYSDNSVTYYDDYSVTNYNIDVSDVDEHLPVDLNTISQYTNNTYVDTVKSSAQKGSTILRDFFVFWHDVDSEIVYVLFGCAIVTLVGAFIGKWGHS